MSARPIRPDEVAAAKTRQLPPEVFLAFNELITEHFDGCRARVMQDDAVAAVCSRLDIDRDSALNRGLLDVEQAYRAEGWKVTYDKPGYNESYEASFLFERT